MQYQYLVCRVLDFCFEDAVKIELYVVGTNLVESESFIIANHPALELPTKVKNQCESLKKESAQRTESQAKAPGCRLRKKLPLGKDLLPGFARLFFLGQTEFLTQTTGLQDTF
ncbi:TSC22 domain family protein 1 [Grus japonensis]|uniref:TSC22 domain family protein 1 n=1 Tax=Grus japonensis TaxID=30415 RepID=A0ABC9W3W6_GRUJA